MTVLITDPLVGQRLIDERRRTGADRYDEVWDGVYVMAPMANNEHQRLVTSLAHIFATVLGKPELVFAGTNVSDRRSGWEQNYRCPDVAVFLPENAAEDCGTHWLGGPDFVVEIVSPRDRSREKLPFYAAVQTREVLIIDRDPWQLELYRLENGKLARGDDARPAAAGWVESNAIPCAFQLEVEGDTASLNVRDSVTGQLWTI